MGRSNMGKNLSAIDWLNGLLGFVIFIFYIFSIPGNPYTYKPLIIIALSFFIIYLAVIFRKQIVKEPVKYKLSVLKKIYLDFYPLIFLFVIFESFFMILPYFNRHDYDTQLFNLDYKLLGVHPTLWIEQFVRPWLTDLLYSLYLFYFIFPFFILVYLYKKKKYKELDRSVFILLLVYYGAYISYFIFPAMGPRFYEPLMQMQSKTLNGVFLAIPIRHLIGIFEPNKFDAFPSLHTAISLSTIILMAKYNKKMFIIFIPVVIGIWISLVYCRYHYVVDMIVGIFWTILAFYLGNQIYNKLIKFKLPLFFKDNQDAN